MMGTHYWIDKITQLEASNAAMSSALKSIREYIVTLEADALGTDEMFGYSYRDEMVDNIDKALLGALGIGD